MKRFKPDLIEYAIALIFLPFTLFAIFTVIVLIISIINRVNFDLMVIPWQVYLVVGAIYLFCNLLYLFFYFTSRKVIYINNERLIYEDSQKKFWEINKNQIEKIEYVKHPFFLCCFYDDYGLMTIYCNESGNYIKKKFRVFRHTKKLLEQELGFKVDIIK